MSEMGPPRKSNRNLLIVGAAALAVIIAVVVAAFVMMSDGGGGKSEAAAGTRVLPKDYVSTQANSLVKKINERSNDKRPLNEKEVFSDQAKNVTYKTYSFDLAASDLVPDCATVTWGGQLQGDLKRYGCTQVARGAYVSRDKQYVGQFIAINLQQLEGAEQIIRDLDPDSRAGFVSPLTIKGHENFGGGFSAAFSQSFGHYAVIAWVERAGGGQPRSMNELLDASIAIQRADGFVWSRLVLAGG